MEDRKNWIHVIEEGMTVYDSAGDSVGTVAGLQYGTRGETATVPDEGGHDSLVQEIAEVFAPDELPEEMRERLLQEGYIRVDKGILQGYGYVPESSIHNVTTDGIHLNIPGDSMLTR
jgi:hypothetical protein